MTNDEISQVLTDAFNLIEADQLQEARNILQPLRATEQNNPDFWWVYAHAVEDPQQAQDALDRLTELDPGYPGAADLIAQLQPMQPTPTISDNIGMTGGIRRLSSNTASSKLSTDDVDDILSSLDNDSDDLNGDDLDFDFDSTTSGSGRSNEQVANRSRFIRIGGIAAIAVLLVAVVALLLGGGNDDEVTTPTEDTSATSVAQGEADENGEPAIPTTPDNSALTATAIVQGALDNSTLDSSPTEEQTEEEVETTAIFDDPQPGTSGENDEEDEDIETTASESIDETLETPTEATEELDETETTDITSTEVVTEIPDEPTDAMEPTDEVSDGEVNETLVVDPTATDEVTVAEDTPSKGSFIDAFTDLELASETTEVVETALGSTLVVSVCSAPGSALRITLNEAMSTAANANQQITEEVNGLAVHLIDCEQDTTLNVIGTSLEDAIAFANGDLPEAEFRGRWQVVTLN